MKYKKIIIFSTVILLLLCLYSCTDKNYVEHDTNTSENEEVINVIDITTTEELIEPTEPATPEPIEIEVFQVPDIPNDFITANITDISSGNVFGKNFRRGINMGNMLEASPDEGSWGVYFEPEYFKLIKQRGFDFVRLPVGWGNHLMLRSDNTIIIEKTFMARVKYIVDEAIKNDLGIIVNIHHYNDMDDNPEKYCERLYQIWRIISTSFQNYPANVVFEVFNEPHNNITKSNWNNYQNECIKIIRETNPKRKIVVSGADWGGISGIMDLMIPEDENLILSFHCYDPFNFTHQGADWADNMDQYLGTKWTGSDFEKRSLDNTFKKVKAWSESTGLPVLLGEFGAYSKAGMDSRVLWTEYMRETAEYYGFAWSYWEFCAGFGIYDPDAEEFFDSLADALTGTPVNESIYGTGTGMPKITAERGLGYFGPFKTERNMNIICDSWTGMSLFDTENNTQIIDLGENSVNDWAQAFITLDDLGLTDTGDGFSHDKCELTIRNIEGSITDFCINLDNGGADNYTETQLAWIDEKTLKDNKKIQKHEIIQNGDGTTTIILYLQSGYNSLKNKCGDGIRLKLFIESVPDRSKNYDRTGSVEFIKIELK